MTAKVQDSFVLPLKDLFVTFSKLHLNVGICLNFVFRYFIQIYLTYFTFRCKNLLYKKINSLKIIILKKRQLASFKGKNHKEIIQEKSIYFLGIEKNVYRYSFYNAIVTFQNNCALCNSALSKT